MRVYLLVILHILFLASNADAGRVIEGVVKIVYDGDTVQLLTRSNSRLKMRLYGIDAPEIRKPDKPGQSYADRSKVVLKSKIMGRRVSAEVVDVDQYERAVAIVRYSGRDVNREMLEEGMAWAYRKYLQSPYESKYIDSENRARLRRAGLWRDANPKAPWDFRHEVKRKKQKRYWY
ncbi:MAG: thermonuclease family protein [Desulfuromonadaceae bacterium]|nr:thermonuclease family protein [Desulfuromonadaceae bacterium]MDD2853978.1 thermonuclease family protein [Desulfuromonadaceae bacterium]